MKIAIVKLSALGDIIHTMVALQFIKNHYPDSQIDWIVDEQFKSILENNPHIRKIHTVAFKKSKKEKSILLILNELKKIRALEKYDLVIDAQGLIKSAIVTRMVSAKKHIGFGKKSIREPLASIFYNQKVLIGYDQNSIDRNIKVICSPLNIKVDNDEIIDKQTFIFSSNQNQLIIKPYIVFVVGSTWESRNYPKEKFVEVARKLNKKCVVVWGNSKEKEKAEWMEKQSSLIKSSQELNIDELKQLINKSILIIGNDTGPSHLAWGMNRPSIILFGPTPISRVYQTKINRVLKSSSKVNPFILDKNDFSIKEIKVDDIVEMSQELMKVSL
jgi:heptosyltransferase-1